MTTLSGADISDYQKDIDWPTFKNNVNFVIAKATEGTTLIDEWFGNNRQQARNANLLRGWYHFAHPDLGNTPAQEAQFFINVMNGDPLQAGESIYLDYEENVPNNGDNVAWAMEWMDFVYNALKVKPIFYSYQSLITASDFSPVVNKGYKLWVAAPTNDPANNTYKTGAWPSAIMQQWGNQTIPGISTGPVDSDIFFGDEDTFKLYGYQASTPTPAPTPTPTPEPPCMPMSDVNTISAILGLPVDSTKDAIISAITQLQKGEQTAVSNSNNLNKQIPALTARAETAEAKVTTLTQQLSDEKILALNGQGQSYKDLYNALLNDFTTKQAAWGAQFSTDVAVFSQLKRNNIYYLPTSTIFSIWTQRVTGQTKQNIPPPLTPADFTYAKSVPQPPIETTTTKGVNKS